MRLSLPTIIILTLILFGCSQSSKDPLTFLSPDGWKVEHKTPGDFHFYSLRAGPPGGGLLMFSQWPVPSRPEDIPTLVRQWADDLPSHEYQVEQFTGEQSQGSYVVFQIGSSASNLMQSIFFLSVDGSIWNGQFTGPSNEWAQALIVLKSIRQAD